jgi:hypothetical protein
MLVMSSIVLKSGFLYFLDAEKVFLENDSTRYLNLASDFHQNYVSLGLLPNPDAFYVTPGYPLFLSLLSALEIRQIIFVQFCILGMTQILCYRILKNLFQPRIALLGLSIFLLESSTNVESFHILTETLFGIFFLAFLYFFSKNTISKLNPIIAGGFLGSSLLIRPVAQILIVALVITLLIAKQKKNIAICLFLSVAILSSWLIRNNNVFGIPQLSGIQSLNLLYYEGAGAASIAKSQTLENTQTLEGAREASSLGEAPNLISIVRYRQDRGIALIKSNFLGFVELHAKGSIKILLGPGSATIDEIVSHMPLGTLPGYIYKFFSIALSLLLALLSFFAIWLLFWHKQRIGKFFHVFVALSFLLLLVSSGGANAYSRFRVPLIPLEIIIICIGLSNPIQRAWLKITLSKLRE